MHARNPAPSLRRHLESLLFAALLLVAGERPLHAAEGGDAEASRLLASAEQRLATQTIEMRRVAIAELEHALELSPRRLDVLLTLARAYDQAGYRKQSRLRYERALALADDNFEARFGLAQAWRRDWLKYVEPRSLGRAIELYAACVRTDPTRLEPWLQLSALEIEHGNLRAASAAAEHALATDPGRADAMLAAASTRYRQGQLLASDTLFRRAIGRLRRSVRERFEDFAPLATERDTTIYRRMSPEGREDYVRQFWREHDPDLATSENEAQIEYWSRVAQAYFLYYDAKRRVWDERGEIYVRYGPPEEMRYNPVGTMLYTPWTGVGNNLRFPMNVLVWFYHRLGMVVILNDRSLTENYELPVSMDFDTDPRPSPGPLAASGLLWTPGLRGVFSPLPPGVEPLDVASQLARFEGTDGGARLFAGLSAPGSPADSLQAEFVVLDSAYREVYRQRRSLSPSACEPADMRVADFDVALPPGRYLVGLSAGAGTRRGTTKEKLLIAEADSSLAMSDVVVTCGLPTGPVGTVRLDPNPSGHVEPGEPLVAYFEVYHLARGADGEGRFEYETSVRSATPDRRVWLQRWLSPKREGEGLGFTRQDKVLGTVRRQYVSVPLTGLLPGHYRLEVTVRDVVAGDERHNFVEFWL
jgi:GWxTD domain-containing protein